MDSEFLIQALQRCDPATDPLKTVRQILWDHVRQHAPIPGNLRPFQPESRFEAGDWVGIDGDVARVVEVREGGNPRQGGFAVVDLEMRDGSRRCVATQSPAPFSTPNPDGDLSFAVPDSLVHGVLATHGDALREEAPWLNLSDIRDLDPDTFPASPAVPPDSMSHLATVPQIRPLHFLPDDSLEELWSEHLDWEKRARSMLSTFCSLWQPASNSESACLPEDIQTCFVQPLLDALGWQPLRLQKITDPDSTGCDRNRGDVYARWALCISDEQQQALRHSLQDGKTDNLSAPMVLNTGLSFNTDPGEASHEFDELALNTIADLTLGDVRWGGVTDGRRWRLYSRRWGNPDIGSTAAEFYEVDLTPVIDQMASTGEISQEAWRAFQRWWLLCRRDTYVRTPEGRALIEILQETFASRTRRKVKRLRDLVLDRVLPKIAGGFVAYRHQVLSVREENDASLQEVGRASLSMVYKLLVVLYAETRRLLPMDNAAYRASSLTTLAHWAEHMIRRGAPLSASIANTPRYDAVCSLFRRLDHGAPELGLLRIEGGLFGATEPSHAFLERHRLSDHVIAQVLHTLSVEGEVESVFAAMDLRHLCMVGGELLQNALWVVDAALGEVTWFDNHTEPRAIAEKSTADYVVISTVEDALGPILSARALDFEKAMDQLMRLQQSTSEGRLDRESPAVQARIAKAEDLAEQALLGVRILDPAMGAGHFLIAAADVITDWAVAQYQTYCRTHPDFPESWNPILRALVADRHRVRHRMSSLGLNLRPGWPDDLALIASRVAKMCIYGVDIDPIAVSLAKANLSLWAFARGGGEMQFGSHLCRGNSLLGGRLQDLDFPSKHDLDMMGGVSSLGARISRLDDPRESLPLERAALDLWLSQFVGNEDVTRLLQRASDVVRFLDQPVESRPTAWNRALIRAEELSIQEGFIHWDLVFPEVFHDPRHAENGVRPGFDVVIGSPPTIGPEHGRHVGSLSVSRSDDVHPSAADRSGLFERLAHQLVRSPGGRIALVMTPEHLRSIGR